MPQTRSAHKDIRKAKKRHRRNVGIKSELSTLIKQFINFLEEKKIDKASAALRAVTSKLGKAATKRIINKKSASRKISRLAKKLHKIKSAK
ncbi:MAG: 30S ribosomal protein S20 [Candidatus Omnitrophota bacterium]